MLQETATPQAVSFVHYPATKPNSSNFEPLLYFYFINSRYDTVDFLKYYAKNLFTRFLAYNYYSYYCYLLLFMYKK